MANTPPKRRIALLGSVGVPARYGGFETLADHLVRYHAAQARPDALTVYCSRPAYPDTPERYGQANLRYSALRANGASSILYDAMTFRDAVRRGVDIIVLLGVSGAIALPVLPRRGARVIVHVDGLEWRRGKWSAPARRFLRWSEALAVRHADAIIADSPAIADHLRDTYGREADVIAYGGDHAVRAPDPPSTEPSVDLPDGYALALCRIEPENNVDMILAAFARAAQPLVVVGNWNDSAYGRDLRRRYGAHPTIRLRDPIYAPGPLYRMRMGAGLYVHGHSAGGTNPALVEMMHVGRPILAFDCVYNRLTTQGEALYFKDVDALVHCLSAPIPPELGARMVVIGERDFTWNRIGAQYFDLFDRVAPPRA